MRFRRQLARSTICLKNHIVKHFHSHVYVLRLTHFRAKKKGSKWCHLTIFLFPLLFLKVRGDHHQSFPIYTKSSQLCTELNTHGVSSYSVTILNNFPCKMDI